MNIEPQKLRYISLCIAAVFLQTAMLLTAALIWYGSIALPLAAAVIFAVAGAGSFAAAIFCGCKAVPSDKVKKPKPEPVIQQPQQVFAASAAPIRQPISVPQSRAYSGDGDTAMLFNGSLKTDFGSDETVISNTNQHGMSGLLLSWVDNGESRRCELFNFPAIIGREASLCSVVISDAKVSRQHAVITYVTGDFFISDGFGGKRSSNGIKLDGDTVTAETQLHSGQTIKLGNTSISVEVIA
jgi:hypothetical protein